MDSKIRILPAEEKHIPACIRIREIAYTHIHSVYTELMGEELHEAFMGDWVAKNAVVVAENLRTGSAAGRAFVAVAEEQVVGFVSYHVDNMGCGVISNNAVAPDWRGQGVGGLLYERCFAGMRAEGIAYATVVTGGDDAHAPARRAYEKAGFEKFLPSRRYFKKL